MSITRIVVKPRCLIDIWPSAIGVGVEITNDSKHRGVAFLTTDQTDELIRALAAARVELSKARP